MKNFLFLAVLFLTFTLQAQVKNVNPDPNGEPWLVGGWKSPTAEELAKIPILKIDQKYKTRSLPTSLDNSTLQYFRPIFNQSGGCCAQASGIAYNFTYEINRAKGTSANVTSNQFPTHYTYNFLNSGDDNIGSWYGDGWSIIKANGCPTIATYGGISQDATYWMSGFSKYESGMTYRVADIFDIDVSNPAGLETMKWWMYNHGDGSLTGGIVNFSAGISIDDYNITGNDIITKWGYSVNHAMTFVGWDDNIGYDVNGDGQITNNIDITSDGIVDMRDWEKGAMIMVNSWGSYFGNNGKAYVLYRLLALPVSEGGIGNGNLVSSIHVKTTYSKQMIMRVTMQHTDRSMIKIIAGISADTNSTTPQHTISFPLFNYQGGSYSMCGINSNPISFSLDITPLLTYANNGQSTKYFLQVYESDPNGSATGTIQSFEIVDGSNNAYNCSQTNVSIQNNNVTTLSVKASVNYNAPEITTNSLPVANQFQNYSTQLLASGGSAPYIWGVLYNFAEQNISETYPNITTNQITINDDDDGYGIKKIGFEFPFGGKSYDTIYVRTDGSIAFESGFTYLRTEDAIKNSKIISVFASDLMIYPADGDGIFYQGDANSATFRWKTSLFGDQSANIDAAIRLFPDGTIKLFYGNGITNGLAWAAGVSSGDGMNDLIASFSGISNPSNKQIVITGNPFPQGMNIAKDGTLQGIPTEYGNWDINFYCTDFNNISTFKSINFAINQANGLNNLTNSLSIYPNPTKGKINIQTAEKIENVKIFDISGKTIIESSNSEIDISGNQSGLYFIKIKTNKGIYNQKLILEK